MEWIGLDLGEKRTGVARASSLAKIAEPLASVETAELMEYLRKLDNLEAIVIGLPRNLRGDDTAQTIWVRDFVKQLGNNFDTPMYWQDEALTSQEAAVAQKAKTKGQADEHALAAKIILEDWIDTPVENRVRC